MVLSFISYSKILKCLNYKNSLKKIRPNSKPSTSTLEYQRYIILPFLSYSGSDYFPVLGYFKYQEKNKQTSKMLIL